MNKKVLIVGGVAGGASTAARLRRLDEDVEIIMFERGEYISFANCGLPYYIGGIISDREDLLVQTPKAMRDRFKIDVRIKNKVLSIDRKNKKVKVKDLDKNKGYEEKYDILVLSPGADPIKPPIDGIEGDKIFYLRNVRDTDLINDFIEDTNPKRAVVVGAGYIGVEMAENLTHRGIETSIVEMQDQILTSLDKEMVAQAHNHMRMNGIDLYLENTVKAIGDVAGKKVIELKNRNKISTDFIVMAAGVSPNIKLAEDADLEIGKLGAIEVDKNLKTSDENIYALGDAVEVKHPVKDSETYIPLAGPANKQGRIVANNICGMGEEFDGSQGTAIAKVFNMTVGSTGLNEKEIIENNMEYQKSYTIVKNHAGYYPGAVPMSIKLLFSGKNGQLYGAQVVGYEGVAKRLDVFAAAVRFKKTIFDLKDIDLAYAPPFGNAKDPVNMAGYVSENTFNELVKNICCLTLDDMNKNDDIQLIDVREDEEVKMGMIRGAIHIPLNSLRDKMDKLERNKKTVIYCAAGLRGYLGTRILEEHGFEDVYNLAGGYKMYIEHKKDEYEVIDETATKANAVIETIMTPEEAHRL